MMRLLLPLVLLLVGVGGGVGAGLLLAPPEPEPEEIANPCGPAPDGTAATDGSHDEAAQGESAATGDEDPEAQDTAAYDYVKLNNQFVVPLLTEGRVASLVMLSLSLEVPAGQEEQALTLEPKLRDIFLQVLFDHANTGGFDGLFTAASAMRELRKALLDAAQGEVGELVTDVLITDLVRQEQ